MELTALPNIGPKLAENLRQAGIETAEELRVLGAEEAFRRIRAVSDPAACFHQCTALAAAELGIPKKALPPERKTALRAFFDSL